mgnify:FL=1
MTENPINQQDSSQFFFLLSTLIFLGEIELSIEKIIEPHISSLNKQLIEIDRKFNKRVYFQALLQTHDVVAQEIYGDGAVRIAPAYCGQNTVASENNYDNDYVPHNGSGANDVPGDNLSDTACDVTRVRLVQFQRNTDEPLVKKKH